MVEFAAGGVEGTLFLLRAVMNEWAAVLLDHTAEKAVYSHFSERRWQPYLDVIGEKCSQALHILDRFHIVAKMNKALDEVRAAESRKMARTVHDCGR